MHRMFLEFVLSYYVSVGVEELDQEKLAPLLRLKYHDSVADAVADLGQPEEIGKVFSGVQKYLYQRQSVDENSFSIMDLTKKLRMVRNRMSANGIYITKICTEKTQDCCCKAYDNRDLRDLFFCPTKRF